MDLARFVTRILEAWTWAGRSADWYARAENIKTLSVLSAIWTSKRRWCLIRGCWNLTSSFADTANVNLIFCKGSSSRQLYVEDWRYFGISPGHVWYGTNQILFLGIFSIWHDVNNKSKVMQSFKNFKNWEAWTFRQTRHGCIRIGEKEKSHTS